MRDLHVSSERVSASRRRIAPMSASNWCFDTARDKSSSVPVSEIIFSSAFAHFSPQRRQKTSRTSAPTTSRWRFIEKMSPGSLARLHRPAILTACITDLNERCRFSICGTYSRSVNSRTEEGRTIIAALNFPAGVSRRLLPLRATYIAPESGT